MIWNVCGEKLLSRAPIDSTCLSDNVRAESRFCSEMICSFCSAIVVCCNSIVDCCLELITSSNEKSSTLQSVSMMTPQMTSLVAISRTESGPPSQTIPAPTAIVPSTAPPNKYIWTHNAIRSVTNAVNVSVHILPGSLVVYLETEGEMIVSLYFCFLGSSTILRSPLELFLQAYITLIEVPIIISRIPDEMI